MPQGIEWFEGLSAEEQSDTLRAPPVTFLQSGTRHR